MVFSNTHNECLYSFVSPLNPTQILNQKCRIEFEIQTGRTQLSFIFHQLSSVYLDSSCGHSMIVCSSKNSRSARAKFRSDFTETLCLVMISKQRHSLDSLLTAFHSVEVILPEATVKQPSNIILAPTVAITEDKYCVDYFPFKKQPHKNISENIFIFADFGFWTTTVLLI